MAEETMEPVPVHPETGRVQETPESRAKGLRILRAKMEACIASGEVPRYPRMDDQFLLPFLRARKYKIDDSLSCINHFAAFWYRRADIVEGLCADSPGVQAVQNSGMMRLLRGSDVFGNAVTALDMGKLEPEALVPRHQMQYGLYMLLQLFENEEWQLQGVTYVETMAGFSLFNAMAMGRKMDSKEQKEMMAMGSDTFPMRIRSILLIHQPWYFSMFWALVRPFLKAKLTKRLRLLGGDLAALHAVVPPAVLPSAYGGTLSDAAEPPDWQLADMRRREREGDGCIGGWALPLSVEDPTGEARRRARVAAAAAVAVSETEGAPGGGGPVPAI